MRIPSILWCIINSLCLIQSEKCVSKYFKIFRSRRRSGTPVEKTLTNSEFMCVTRCMNKKWCQAINFINKNELQHCELFGEHQAGQIINDELSVYYCALDVEDNTNQTHDVVPVSSTVHAPSLTTSSSVPILPSSSSSALPLAITSSSMAIIPSSVTPHSMTSSVTSPVTTSMPAVACKKIFQDDPNSPDGQYTIFSGTASQTNVFCDMTGTSTGCKGGGWTLVMRINGQQQTFEYGSYRWTNKQDYQSYFGQWLDRSEETKMSTYHTTPFTQICLGMKYNNEKGWTTLNLTSTSLFDLISSNTYHPSDLTVPDWKGLIPSGVVLQPNCPIQGINVQRGDTGVRIGIIATNTCGVNSDYNSRLGFGAKGTSCGQDGTNRCGYDARCIPSGSSKKTMGYILVK